MKNYTVVFLLLISGLVFGQNPTAKYSVSQVLTEVTVSAKKKMIVYEKGNIKVDVANSILNTASNTLDLLTKLPNILISADNETLSLIGKGNPLLYIDNQKVGFKALSTLSVI